MQTIARPLATIGVPIGEYIQHNNIHTKGASLRAKTLIQSFAGCDIVLHYD